MNYFVHLSTRRLKWLLVGLPMLVYTGYLLAIAVDRFTSESVITVRQAGGDGGGVPGAALLLAGINPPAHEDTLILKDFVWSQGLLERLEPRLKLREHYANAGLDWPFRLSTGASKESFLQFYRDRVSVSFDEKAALLKLRVQGFDPVFAQSLNKALLDESERFVNETSHRIARERLRFAEGELEIAAKRLAKARNEVLSFQTTNRLLDPGASAQASVGILSELEGSRSKQEAELQALRSVLNDQSYQVRAAKAKLAALQQQIGIERRRATVANGEGARLNQLTLEFQGLQAQAEFARDGYKLALAAVENARIDTTRKIKSLVIVEPPSLAETAEYPRVLYNLATLLAFCVLLYAVLRLVLATIREHQD